MRYRIFLSSHWIRSVIMIVLLLVGNSEVFANKTEPEKKNVVSIQVSLDKRTNLLPLLLTNLPHVEGNAADDYIKSLEALQSESPMLELDISWIEKGTEKKDCSFYPNYFEVVTSSGFPPAHVFNLRSFANKLRAKAEKMLSQRESGKALAIYEKIIIYGWHIEKEKLTLVQVGVGLEIQKNGISGLLDIYKKNGQIEKETLCKNYLKEVKRIIECIKSKARSALVSDKVAIDVLFNDEEPLWRRWAITVLGRRVSYPGELLNIKRDVQLSGEVRLNATKRALENEKDSLTKETARIFLGLIR